MRFVSVLSVMAIATVSCVTIGSEDVYSPPAAGAPCPNDHYSEILDGLKFFDIEGRLVTRDGSDVLRPVTSARLFYWYLRDNPEARHPKLDINEHGQFKARIAIPWSRHLSCRDGRVAASEVVGREQFVIRGLGCGESMIVVGDDWSQHDIELSCAKVQRSG